jgi:hypothetical protein
MLSKNFTLTKRLLGILMLSAGILGFAAILMIDILDVGRQGGIGPSQQLALGAMAALALVGLSLIPLGNTPA